MTSCRSAINAGESARRTTVKPSSRRRSTVIHSSYPSIGGRSSPEASPGAIDALFDGIPCLASIMLFSPEQVESLL